MPRNKKPLPALEQRVPTLRDVVTDIEEFCRERYGSAPCFHTSQPIANEEELQEVYAGTRFVYPRWKGHPDHSALEEWIAKFEGAGAARPVRARSDGMGAVTAALAGAVFARPFPIAHFIFILPLYGGTLDAAELLQDIPCAHFEFTYLYANDPHLLSRLRGAIRKNTVAILGETLGNPTLQFTPIKEVAEIAHNHPVARPLVIWDDTLLFGIVRPLLWGADCVVASDTKYLVDESTWPAGHFAFSQECVEQEPIFCSATNRWATLVGGTLGPFEAWATLKFAAPHVLANMKLHSQNAMQVAQFLEKHPCVERVVYPGLPSYPDREKLLPYLEPIDGELCFGGMISFYLRGEGIEDAKNFLYWMTQHTHIGFMASMAGHEDKQQSAVLLSHKKMEPIHRIICQITDNQIRLSIGREPVKRTIAALKAGFRATIAT